jgi:hypothetical protein
MLVARFFGGGASSVSITLVAGTITDIWKGDRVSSRGDTLSKTMILITP